jgi:hypothetical protein
VEAAASKLVAAPAAPASEAKAALGAWSGTMPTPKPEMWPVRVAVTVLVWVLMTLTLSSPRLVT